MKHHENPQKVSDSSTFQIVDFPIRNIQAVLMLSGPEIWSSNFAHCLKSAFQKTYKHGEKEIEAKGFRQHHFLLCAG